MNPSDSPSGSPTRAPTRVPSRSPTRSPTPGPTKIIVIPGNIVMLIILGCCLCICVCYLILSRRCLMKQTEAFLPDREWKILEEKESGRLTTCPASKFKLKQYSMEELEL